MSNMNEMIETTHILDTFDFCDDVIFYIVEAMNSVLPYDRVSRSLIDSELALCEESIPNYIIHVNDFTDNGYVISKFIASVKFVYAPSEFNREDIKHEIIYHSQTEHPISIEQIVQRYINAPQFQGFFGDGDGNIYAGDDYARGLTYIKDTYGESIYLRVFLKLLFGIAITPLLFNILSLSYEYKIHEKPKKFYSFNKWMYTHRNENTLLITTLWNNIMNFHHSSYIQFIDETLDVFNYHANIYIAIDNDVPTLHMNNLSICVTGSEEAV